MTRFTIAKATIVKSNSNKLTNVFNKEFIQPVPRPPPSPIDKKKMEQIHKNALRQKLLSQRKAEIRYKRKLYAAKEKRAKELQIRIDDAKINGLAKTLLTPRWNKSSFREERYAELEKDNNLHPTLALKIILWFQLWAGYDRDDRRFNTEPFKASNCYWESHEKLHDEDLKRHNNKFYSRCLMFRFKTKLEDEFHHTFEEIVPE